MSRAANGLRAVIFDLDGTLVDTADEFVPVVQALRAEHGREPMDAQRIRASVSNGARALVSLGLDMHEDDPGFERNGCACWTSTAKFWAVSRAPTPASWSYSTNYSNAVLPGA